jgi:hypothetical protein
LRRVVPVQHGHRTAAHPYSIRVCYRDVLEAVTRKVWV